MNHANNRNGFTLVELMLAMGFVSALLLAIAMTVIQIGNIYNKGITYKNVNQAGSSIANELQRSISGGKPFDLSEDFINKEWGGRLCTGQYSYIWNYGKAISESNSNLNKYSDDNAVIRFVKSPDIGAEYCKDSSSSINFSNSVELLSKGQFDLVIHNFNITSDPSAVDGSTGQQLYNIEFLIGTNDEDTLNADKTACEIGSDQTYCSVSRFNITVRAGGANVSE